jgi:hypothetical protein
MTPSRLIHCYWRFGEPCSFFLQVSYFSLNTLKKKAEGYSKYKYAVAPLTTITLSILTFLLLLLEIKRCAAPFSCRALAMLWQRPLPLFLPGIIVRTVFVFVLRSVCSYRTHVFTNINYVLLFEAWSLTKCSEAMYTTELLTLCLNLLSKNTKITTHRNIILPVLYECEIWFLSNLGIE